MTRTYSSDLAFTPTVKAIQTRKGSRNGYASMEVRGSWGTEIGEGLKSFIEMQISAFLGSASKDGQPYIQHRGGPPGFLKVLDRKTIGFVDFTGNKQYITQGNLADNPRAHLFLIDYRHQRRVKIWGTARVIEDDHDLVDFLMPQRYSGRPEQVVLFSVEAFDVNCPQHIPRLIEAAEAVAAIAERDREIQMLQAEVARLLGNRGP